MTEVYFSLGSNVGDRRKFLDDAINRLAEKVAGLTVSSVYDTEPWGNQDQPRFLNLCAKGRTSLNPLELLAFTQSIEADLGRKHTEKWEPREIDIDIIFYGNEVIESAELKIPHPQLAQRAFVLVPLAEIAGDFIHPSMQKTISKLAADINPSGVEKLKDA